MKKIFYSILIAVIAVNVASCQKINEDKLTPASEEQPLTITGSIVGFDATKVTYGFEAGAQDARADIKQAWASEDKIIVKCRRQDVIVGNYIFTVKNVDNNGVASFAIDNQYSPAEGDILYAAYFPGKTGANIVGTISLSNQNGKLGGNTPAIMCAAGEVVKQKNGTLNVNFLFENQTAIIGIYKMRILKGSDPVKKTVISSVTLKNVPISGKFEYYTSNGKKFWKFIAARDDSGNINLGDITCNGLQLETDEDGFITVDPASPDKFVPFFSVIPGNSDIRVIASDGANSYDCAQIGPRDLIAGTYYCLGKNLTKIVAKIDDVGYYSVGDAISAVLESIEKQTTITMASDTEESFDVPSGKKIILQLAGKTITGSINISGQLTISDDNGQGKISNNATCLTVNSNGSLTLNSGILETSSSSGATVVINEKGNNDDIDGTVVTFNGGEIKQTGTSIRGAIDAKFSTIKFPQSSQTEVSTVGRSFVCGTGVKLEINAGTFKSSKSYTIFLNSGADNSVLINGGTFTAGSNCFQLYGKKTNVNVMGGSFKWDEHEDFLYLASYAEPSQLKISGGEYSDCILADILSSDGYGIQKKSDEYEYEVILPENGCEAEYTSNNNTYRYVSVTDALQDASNTSTVKLLKDCTNKMEKHLGASQHLTLDLNEHVLTIQGKNRITPNDATAKLTIQGNGTMKNSSSGSNLFSFSTGSVILEEGTLTRLDNPEGTSAIVSISGGSFEMKKDTKLNDGGSAINARPLSISGTAKVTISGIVSTNANNSREAVYITGGELTIGGDITAGGTALGVGGLDKVTCTISGGVIKAGKIDAVAVNIDNSNASTEVTIIGETVSIDTPNRDQNNKDIPVVELKQGKLFLKDGTVGVPTSASSDIQGAFTAVRVGDGCFEMTGGTLKAKRHALILNGSGSVDIESECDVQNISSGASYYLIRFDNGSTNTLTISNGYFYAYSKSPVFNTIPDGSTLSISGGYFNKEVKSGIARGHSCKLQTTVHGGLTYNYIVE